VNSFKSLGVMIQLIPLANPIPSIGHTSTRTFLLAVANRYRRKLSNRDDLSDELEVNHAIEVSSR